MPPGMPRQAVSGSDEPTDFVATASTVGRFFPLFFGLEALEMGSFRDLPASLSVADSNVFRSNDGGVGSFRVIRSSMVAGAVKPSGDSFESAGG